MSVKVGPHSSLATRPILDRPRVTLLSLALVGAPIVAPGGLVFDAGIVAIAAVGWHAGC